MHIKFNCNRSKTMEEVGPNYLCNINQPNNNMETPIIAPLNLIYEYKKIKTKVIIIMECLEVACYCWHRGFTLLSYLRGPRQIFMSVHCSHQRTSHRLRTVKPSVQHLLVKLQLQMLSYTDTLLVWQCACYSCCLMQLFNIWNTFPCLLQLVFTVLTFQHKNNDLG